MTAEAKTCCSLLVLYLVATTLISLVAAVDLRGNAIDFSKATTYANNSVMQYLGDALCAYPDPQLDALPPTACGGVAAIIHDAHILATHPGGSISFYNADSGDYLGSAPTFTDREDRNTIVCVTGPRNTFECETMCWHIEICPNADSSCICGSRHSRAMCAFNDGCARQPQAPTWRVARRMLSLLFQ